MGDNDLPRRTFLKLTALGAAGLGLGEVGCASGMAAPAASNPNTAALVILMANLPFDTYETPHSAF
jgi:hypothetical protein